MLRNVLSGVNLRGFNFTGAALPFSGLMGVDSWREYEELDWEVQDSYGFVNEMELPYALCDGLLDGVVLTGADLTGRNLRGASLVGADLRRSDFTDAFLRDANLSDADLSGASLAGTSLEGARLRAANLDGARLVGAVANLRTIELSNWSPGEVRSLMERGLVFAPWTELPAEFRARVLGSGQGLTLTFDTRLHRFDATAFDVLIAEVLGLGTDVTIEGRSMIDAEGPAFIRINGTVPEDLLAVAEAFYQGVWRPTSTGEQSGALAHPTRGVQELFGPSLDRIRADLSEIKVDVAALADPEFREESQRTDQFRTRAQRLAAAVVSEFRRRTLTVLGDEIVDTAIALTTEIASDLRAGIEKAASARFDREVYDLEEADDDTG